MTRTKTTRQHDTLFPLISAILLYFTLPPYNVWILSLVAFVPLLLSLRNTTTTTSAFLQGMIVGILYFFFIALQVSSLNSWWWTGGTTSFLFEQKNIILWTVLAAGIVFSGGFFAVFTATYQKLWGSTLRNAVLFPILWVSLEYVRSSFFVGFLGLGILGVSLHANQYLLQFAYPFTVYGLSIFIITTNILLSELILRTEKRARLLIFFTLIALIVTLYTYGYLRIFSSEHTSTPQDTMIIATVKTPSDQQQNNKEKDVFYRRIFDEITVRKPTIAIFPENILPGMVINETTGVPVGYNTVTKIKEQYDLITSSSRKASTTTFFVGMHTTKDDKRFNSIIAFKNGAIKSIYNKRALLPFTEYIPRPLDKILTLLTPIEKGTGTASFSVDGVSMLPVICAELLNQKLVRTKNNNTIIINVANDGIFNSDAMKQYTRAIAKVRAVENGTYLLRSSKSGMTGIIDPVGVEESIPSKEFGVSFFEIHPAKMLSQYIK